MTKTITAKANTAKGHLEKAQRESVCGANRKAAVHFIKAAELFEDVGFVREAERAWYRAAEHSEKRGWELGRRPKFHA
jgi:hypothetical protein